MLKKSFLSKLLASTGASYKVFMTTQRITAIILAGGQGRRLGGCQKAWLAHQGQFFIEKVLSTLKAQGIENLRISANQELERYQTLDFPVISDDMTLPESPLRGIFSAWQVGQESEILVVPVDVPNQPADLFFRLKKQLDENAECQLAVAHDGEQAQQLFLLAKAEALTKIPEYLRRGQRSVFGWCQEFCLTYADFSDEKEKFLNINTEADLRQLLS
jgi:molybdenum cofactor guanylyltransferase